MKSFVKLLSFIFENKCYTIKFCSLKCCDTPCCDIKCEENTLEFESIDDEWNKIILELDDEGDFEMTDYDI